ncbi:hypothetical protein, partial [Corynebacterium sanguinis]
MTTGDNLDRLGARIYGHDATTKADTRGGRVYGHNDDMDARGARVYGLGDRGAVSHEQHTADDMATPERWRLDEVRPATAVGSYDTLDAIGARIEARHHTGGV